MANNKNSAQSQVEDFIRQASPAIRPLLRDLRRLVREELPEAREEIKWGRPVYSLNHIVCYLAAGENHANLGFYRGIELEDPKGLLQGEGKKLRHIKVYRSDEILEQSYATLLQQAASLDDD